MRTARRHLSGSRDTQTRMWQHLTAFADADTAPRVIADIADFLEHADAVCLLVCAIEARSETLVRFLYAHEHLLLLGDDEKKYASVLHCAAAHGRIAVVQWVLRHRSMRESRNKSHVSRVRPFEPTNARNTSLAMAWVNRNVPYLFPAGVMYEAAKQGDLQVVEWLHTTTQYEPYKAMEFAASRGYLEVAQWVYDHHTSAILPIFSTVAGQITKEAAQIYMLEPLGQLDVMNWIAVFVKKTYFREAFATRKGLMGTYDQRDDDIDWEDAAARDAAFSYRRYKAMDHAAAQGDLASLKQLHADGKWPCSAHAMDCAARGGHLHVVKWLHKNRTEGCTSHAIAGAAGNGHFEVAQWLHANRFEGCRSFAMDVTASHGHLQILQWLYVEYPRFSCSSAFLPCVAANNHKHVLQWLHEEKGFPLELRTLEAAIADGHFELVQWILKKVPGLQTQLTPYHAAKAARSGHFEMTKWLVQDLGLWSPRALLNAAMAGNLELVAWLHGTGYPSDMVDGDSLFEIGKTHPLDLVKWLLEHHLAAPHLASTQKQLFALFAHEPKTVSERFGVVTPLTSSVSKGKWFEWDLHTKEAPSWMRAFTRLTLGAAPTAASSIDWMPMIVAQRGDLPILQSLAEGQHPEMFTKQTMRAILAYTKAGDILEWFQQNCTPPWKFAGPEMIEWATKFKQRNVLLLFAIEGLRQVSRGHAFGTMVHTACRHGHVDMLQWAYDNFGTIFGPALPSSSPPSALVQGDELFWSAAPWHECLLGAAAYGQLDVVQWIYGNGISSVLELICASGFRQTLANTAMASGQLAILKWVYEQQPFWEVQEKHEMHVSMTQAALQEAMNNKLVDVLQWYLEQQQLHCDAINHLGPAFQDRIKNFVATEARGFLPMTEIAFVLPPSSISVGCGAQGPSKGNAFTNL
ncbi:hypothetical protein FI667_g16853, partial [Globisporangium splendens]